MANFRNRPKAELKTLLAELMSKNIAQTLLQLWFADKEYSNKPIKQFTHQELQQISDQFHTWVIIPNGTEGYRTAEVTLGGINCNEISSKTMQANKKADLYFIGEAVDVTGHLGGYNFSVGLGIWCSCQRICISNFATCSTRC